MLKCASEVLVSDVFGQVADVQERLLEVRMGHGLVLDVVGHDDEWDRVFFVSRLWVRVQVFWPVCLFVCSFVRLFVCSSLVSLSLSRVVHAEHAAGGGGPDKK